LPDIIWLIKLTSIRWVAHVARMGDRRGAYCVWWGGLGRQLGRPRCKCEGDIKI